MLRRRSETNEEVIDMEGILEDTIKKASDVAVNSTVDDSTNIGTCEPLNQMMMRKRVGRQHNDKGVDSIMDSDSITVGTNEPLIQIMMRKRALSRYNTTLLLNNHRAHKNKYGTNYADDTNTEHSLNTSITTFKSNFKKNRRATSSNNDQILQGKVCEYNLKSAKEIPIEDIEFKFEGIDFDTTREDQQFITQGGDSVTTSQRSINKIAEEAGVG